MTIAEQASAVAKGVEAIEDYLKQSPLGIDFANTKNPITRMLAEELALVWFEFENRLKNCPIISHIENGQVTLIEYRRLLANLYHQVMEGSGWMARGASNMSSQFIGIRHIVIGHAYEEMRDYQMLEKDFIACGGSAKELHGYSKNIGSEALSAYIYQETSQPNPLAFLGIIFIFEGLGSQKAAQWAALLQKHLGLNEKQVSFLLYHSVHDTNHYQRLKLMLQQPFITEEIAKRIIKAAKVTALLYATQLQEIDNF